MEIAAKYTGKLRKTGTPSVSRNTIHSSKSRFDTRRRMIASSLFGTGFVIGAILPSGGLFDALMTLIEPELLQRFGSNFSAALLSGGFGGLLPVLVLLLFGCCAAGLPIILITPFLCGMADGLLSGAVCTQYGAGGLIFCAAVFLIPSTFRIVTIPPLCSSAMSSSVKCWRFFFGISPDKKIGREETEILIRTAFQTAVWLFAAGFAEGLCGWLLYPLLL